MPITNATTVETYLKKAILSELSYTDLQMELKDGSKQDLTATQYVARLQGLKDPVTNKNMKVA